MRFVVLVVGSENSKGLRRRGARVVAALGGLDGLGCLCRFAAERRGTLALGVGRGGLEGRGDAGDGQSQGEDGGEAGLHFEAKDSGWFKGRW